MFKKLSRLILMLGILFGLFACSSLPTEENSANTTTSSVKFTMENITNSTNSNILFSATESETPSKVAISYKKSGDGEAETSTTIELTAFGSSYITDDVLSLYEGNYEVTKFDVLNDEGETIYSTPVSGSDIATSLDITTPLAHNFEVKEGKISKVDMQVVAVTDTTDPADFGHAAFTFDLVDYSKFYVEVLVLDETEGWVYTTAQVEVKNAEETTIKTASLENKMNKVIVANSDSYTITISKDGYASQELTFTKDDLAKYEKEAMVVKLKKAEASEEGGETEETGEGETFSDSTYTNSIGMEFVLVEAGTFMMGDENTASWGAQPVHQVTLTKDFYIGKYEVTQAQWVAVMGSNPSYNKGDNLPVENVSWFMAQEFITKLNEKEGTNKYRLPTEAEWEFAARGGNKSQGYTYAGSNNLDEVAWYYDNTVNNNYQTHQVGTKKANELGIYDMTGNVWEWCSDWWSDNYGSSEAVSDPSGPSSGWRRVLRGGSWGSSGNFCRVAFRYYGMPGYIGYNDGFRLSCSLK